MIVYTTKVKAKEVKCVVPVDSLMMLRHHIAQIKAEKCQ